MSRGHMQREAASHRITDQMRALNLKVSPEHFQVGGAGFHGASGAWRQSSLAVPAKVGDHKSPACRHGRDDLLPAAAALRESVQERDGHAISRDEIVESNVRALQNHSRIVWM
jgi:hypothetical protein